MVDSSFKLILMTALALCVHATYGQKNQTDALASHIDYSVKPGADFFNYANGNWFKQNPIPATEQSNGIFLTIQDTINSQIRRICESSATLKNAGKGSNKQKIGDFFYSGMDSATLNKKGISDLSDILGQIDRITDLKELSRLTAYLQRIGCSSVFGFNVGQDDKNSNQHVIIIWQGGLSLPDRSYYFDTDARAISIRAKYVEHLTRSFSILGYNEEQAKLAADNLMKLETAIAQACRKREDTRDPFTNYHKLSYAQLTNSSPNFEWNAFFKQAGLQHVDSLMIGQPEFVSSVDGYLKSFPLDSWKNYLKYHLIRGLFSYMDDKTYNEFFGFYASTLRGVEEPKPRWKRVVEETNGSLGELVGQVYVAEYLPKGTKEKLLEIGNAIRTEYAGRIKKLDWMSDVTKQKALVKLNSIIMKIGYPDKWKDMSSVQFDRSSYLRNVMNANEWWFNYTVSKYGKPVDRTEWDMYPQTYNAYYNPSNNEIVVPGCNIIIPGYEGRMADDALLYSIIGGSTFGHEMTHGFDDQGCKYDEKGNLHNWWTSEDSAKFKARTTLIVKQFNDYIAVDSLHVNGELTQGENIADLGGIMMGYEAFCKTKQFKDNQRIAGLSPVKRFFLGYALAWMVNERPETIANQVRSDEHSPAKFRIVGPLSNMPEFYQAFDIRQGDAMWRDASVRVKIW
jgi:putative endopeptidase